MTWVKMAHSSTSGFLLLVAVAVVIAIFADSCIASEYGIPLGKPCDPAVEEQGTETK